jgi:hypothetical protein
MFICLLLFADPYVELWSKLFGEEIKNAFLT